MDGLNWRTRGACNDKQYNPDWWTAAGQNETVLRGYARRVCLERCPVIDQCKAWADGNPELVAYSVYGGLWRGADGKPAEAQPPWVRKVSPIREPKPIDADRLRSLIAAGLSWRSIGRDLGVSRYRAQREAAQLGLCKPPPPKTDRCGEVAGYSAHLRRGEAQCDDCQAAMAKYRQEYKATAERRRQHLDGLEQVGRIANRVRAGAA